jgi:hypothetical protein
LPLDVANRKTVHPICAECLIPGFDGAILSKEWKEALWAKFSMAATQKMRLVDAGSDRSKSPKRYAVSHGAQFLG